MPKARPTRIVGIEEARRIAVRAQLLDGSATGVLDTVHKLGFLQLDPIATVADPSRSCARTAILRASSIPTIRVGRAFGTAAPRANRRSPERIP